MLESVMIIRLATGAMVEVVVPFGFSKAGFLSGCPVELGVVAAFTVLITVDLCVRMLGFYSRES